MIKAVLTPEYRLSFPSLFKPKADDKGILKFRQDMLFPKSIRMSDLAEMKALYNDAIPQEWLVAKFAFRKFEQAFIDGDKKERPEIKNHWILRASSSEKRPPRLLNVDRTLATESQLYAGCYCRSILTVFSYATPDPTTGKIISRGASFGIHTVIKTRDGDPFGSVLSDEEADSLLPKQMNEGELAGLLGE